MMAKKKSVDRKTKLKRRRKNGYVDPAVMDFGMLLRSALIGGFFKALAVHETNDVTPAEKEPETIDVDYIEVPNDQKLLNEGSDIQ